MAAGEAVVVAAAELSLSADIGDEVAALSDRSSASAAVGLLAASSGLLATAEKLLCW